MVTSRPSKTELDSMSVVDLLIKLVQDVSWAQLYRDEIAKRCMKSGKTIFLLLTDHFNVSTVSTVSHAKFAGHERLMIITGPDHRIEHFQEVCEVLARTWDFKDPKKENGGMQMYPEEARDFCANQKYRGESYESLSEKAQGTYWMICDAYRRSQYRILD
jgi:hypothetical protein